MSNNANVRQYQSCRTVLNQIVHEVVYKEFNPVLDENKDTCTLTLSFTKDGQKPLKVYYVFGNSSAVAEYDDDICLLSVCNEVAFHLHIEDVAYEWFNHATLLKNKSKS